MGNKSFRVDTVTEDGSSRSYIKSAVSVRSTWNHQSRLWAQVLKLDPLRAVDAHTKPITDISDFTDVKLIVTNVSLWSPTRCSPERRLSLQRLL